MMKNVDCSTYMLDDETPTTVIDPYPAVYGFMIVYVRNSSEYSTNDAAVELSAIPKNIDYVIY